MTFDLPDVHAFTLTQADRDRVRQAAVRAACADVVRRHAGEHAPLILEALGLDQPAEQGEAPPAPVDGGRTKRCSRCRDVKPSTGFHRDRSSHDGLSYYCRDCRGVLDRGRKREAR